MNDQELLELNRIGLIPGPNESKENFLSRVNYCLNLKNEWQSKIPSDEVMTVSELSKEALNQSKFLFDIQPYWVPLFFSSHQLLPWTAGCAWIFQEDEKNETSAFFQLRPTLKENKSYLNFYDRDELIVHELSHVGRMLFEEPKFEEFIAYRSSSSSLRRFLGSIVQTSKESIIFMLILMFVFFFDLFFLFTNDPVVFKYGLLFKLIPISMILYGIRRSWVRHQTYLKARNQLQKIARKSSLVDAVLYRLTDFEIESFSKWNLEDIQAYFQNQKKQSLRLHLISIAYL